MSQVYPEDCVQYLVGDWWLNDDSRDLKRGRLVKALIPFVDQEPRYLIAEGRSAPTDHTRANYRIEPLRISAPFRAPELPIAALPDYPGEVRAVYRAKVRPAVVVSVGGPEIPRALRRGEARYQSAPAVLVAPAFGTERGGSRGGWNPTFVQRIRRCEYPQYLWDKLPIGGSAESVIRFDHIQPVGRHPNAMEITNHYLSQEAIALQDEWLTWLTTGEFPIDSVLRDIREEFLRLSEQ